MAYLSRRYLGLVVSVSAGIGMAFSLCLTIGRYNATVTNGHQRPQSALRLCKGEADVSSNPSRWQWSAPIRYPDPDIVVLDPRFQRLVVAMAAIERIATGFRFTEGPAYYGDGRYLLFSDIPNDALLRWTRSPAPSPRCAIQRAVPTATRATAGRLITCELGSRTLTRASATAR